MHPDEMMLRFINGMGTLSEFLARIFADALSSG
jgi:hypothetical protein